METWKVLLGSSSRFRRKLLSRAIDEVNKETERKVEAITWLNIVPDIDEKAIRREDPKDLVLAITTAKTNEMIKLLKERNITDVDVLVCGDQVIGYENTIREKATDEAQVKEFLQSYGKNKVPAVCYSCIEVTNLKTGQRNIEVDIAKAFFKEVPDDVVQKLIDKEDILFCAGSFVIEDELLQPYIEKVEGELETIQGMPRTLTKNLILKALN